MFPFCPSWLIFPLDFPLSLLPVFAPFEVPVLTATASLILNIILISK